jgi:hypothetical protein
MGVRCSRERLTGWGVHDEMSYLDGVFVCVPKKKNKERKSRRIRERRKKGRTRERVRERSSSIYNFFSGRS